MGNQINLQQFLEKKRDFSPFLVHLTKDDTNIYDDSDIPFMSAEQVLEKILTEKTLKAMNHYCLFSPSLKQKANDRPFILDKFKVVCFTETPIGQIDILLQEVAERDFKPKPYGLVFTKEYIRNRGGNPVFYVTKEIGKPLWKLYWPLLETEVKDEICKVLALVTVCEKGNDWHWEREWRFVGNLSFSLFDVYCGLCPEDSVPYFEDKYPPVKFIDPTWGQNKILNKVVGR